MAIFTRLTPEARATFETRDLEPVCCDCRAEIGLDERYINLDGAGTRVRHHPLVCSDCYEGRAMKRVQQLKDELARAQSTLWVIERELQGDR